jgi:exodeoxyribonuclease V gamma subunit
MPVALDELARFMRDPAKALLHDRLGVRLAESEGVLDATEPFDLGPLELSAVQRNAFAALVAGVAPDAAFAIERARGTLPQGEAGRTLFAKVVSEVEPLARKAGSAGEPETIIIDREIGSERLVGGVRVGPVFYPGKLNARRRIALWVRHLAAQLAGGPHETAVHGLDTSVVFVPVHEAEMRLTELLALYRRGQSTLVPFFPKTSLAYAERAAEDEEAALRDARRAWEGDDYGKVRAERDEDYAALAWRGIGDPLDDSFRSLAVEILGPMIAATQKGAA